ncbi:MAG: hypothetical protein E7177_07865 [Erysipelotrichaceae bacterium]|nr:hypothetical protein [Erysipelotrichaceae bacterium]
MDLEKSIYINELYDLYGSLLTKKQQEMIELYYCDDLSLSEISEQFNVSRNAVYDCLKKGIKQLENYEKELKLHQKEEELTNFFYEIKIKNKDQISLIEEIERKVK